MIDLEIPVFLRRKIGSTSAPGPVAPSKPQASSDVHSTEGSVRLYLTGVRDTRGGVVCDGWHNVRIKSQGPKWVRFTASGKNVKMRAGAFREFERRTLAMRQRNGHVMLATQDEDLGIVPASTAKAEAQAIANETGQRVTVRDPISDKVQETVKPKGKGAKTMQTQTATKTRPAKPRKVAKKAAKKAATKKPVAKKVTKAASDKATMTEALIKLAQRPNGVTPAELNEVSQWKGAPWKWLFENSKGTGWAQKRGLKFRVEKIEGVTTYFLSK